MAMMDRETREALQSVASLAENQTCADCGEREPVWASLGFGILICLNCAGHHRSLGVHITKCGGNEAFQQFLQSLRLVDIPTVRGKYENPQLLYYSEILKAKVEERAPTEYDEAFWRANMGSSSTSTPNGSTKTPPASWVPDQTASGCMVCWKPFSLLNRRHHCRRCGKVCCGDCAPATNSRPIMEWGLRDPVRHCKVCYRSPAVQWKDTA